MGGFCALIRGFERHHWGSPPWSADPLSAVSAPFIQNVTSSVLA